VTTPAVLKSDKNEDSEVHDYGLMASKI